MFFARIFVECAEIFESQVPLSQRDSRKRKSLGGSELAEAANFSAFDDQANVHRSPSSVLLQRVLLLRCDSTV